MKNIYHTLWILCLAAVLVACKNDIEDSKSMNDKEIINTETKPLSKEAKRELNSIFSKLMITQELKTYVRFIISADLVEVLSNQKGPFTVLAPTIDAFNNIPKEKMNLLLNYNKKEILIDLVKTHIVEGNLDSATLVQSINKNGGIYNLKTLSGVTLTASMIGNEIVIKDNKGVKAIIGKSDINGSNGVVHVLDTVLGLN